MASFNSKRIISTKQQEVSFLLAVFCAVSSFFLFCWTATRIDSTPVSVIGAASPYDLYNTATATATATPGIPGLLLPHGDFALDPTLVDDFDENTRRAAYEVANGSRRAASSFLESILLDVSHQDDAKLLAPPTNTILLVTPHGIQLDHDFGLYMARTGSGTATIGHDLGPGGGGGGGGGGKKQEYNITMSNVPMDLESSQSLLEFLQTSRRPRNQNVSGIYPYNEESPMPLDWGELVPLKLLQEELMAKRKHPQEQGNHNNVKYMILSMPHRRYNHSVEMVPELLNLGERIGKWMRMRMRPPQQRKESNRFSVIISGDLSHTHQASGPYGYSNTSTPFDAAVGKWASSSSSSSSSSLLDPSCCRCQHHHHTEGDEDPLLETARRLQPQALSCGFTGYVLWQGILQSQGKSSMICRGGGDGGGGAIQSKNNNITRDNKKEHVDTIVLWSNSSTANTTSDSGRRVATALLRGMKKILLLNDEEEEMSQGENAVGGGGGGLTDGSRRNNDKNQVLLVTKRSLLHSKVYANRNVTYYGMLAATFLWENESF